MIMMASTVIASSVMLAFAFDFLFGEPKKLHPLVGFGHWANLIEGKLNSTYQVSCEKQKGSAVMLRILGIAAYCIVVVPFLMLAVVLNHWLWSFILHDGALITTLIFAVILYLCIGWKSLMEHADAIRKPLAEGDITAARNALSMIVSRDTQQLEEKDIAKAATESVLENGADAIFSAIFWFCLFGIPGVIVYRLSNTLDAMWGYKNARFIYFGWFAARVDDVLNFIPARLCAASYAVLGNRSLALACWRKQAATWKSPNAGPVMAAGAGALNVSLGGSANYHGQLQYRPVLGPQEASNTSANAGSLVCACRLVTKALFLWVGAISLMSLVV